MKKVTPRDPLIEKIIQATDQKELEKRALFELLSTADVVYLSEKHDNPRHHKIQLEVLQELVKKGKKPAVGFEFFFREQTGYLMDYIQGKPSPFMGKSKAHTPGKVLRAKLGWQHRSDDDWGYYYQLIELAKKHNLVLFGTDLSPAMTLRIRRYGLEKLSRFERSQLGTTSFENKAYETMMLQRFKSAHCGMGSPSFLKPFYEAWLARNDSMAFAISDMTAEVDGPVVVIVGAGHTRNNMGVVERVAHLKPNLKQVNLGLTEVWQEGSALEAYLEGEQVDDVKFGPAHDFFWFTDRVDSVDHCEKFKAQIQKMKSKSKSEK